MFTITIKIASPNACMAHYRYDFARCVESHLHLVCIHSVKLGIPGIGYLYFLAVSALLRNPQHPPLINIIGGSSHGADIPQLTLEKIFRSVAEKVGIKHGFLCLHFSRSGRVDFHFLFVNSDPIGRPLVVNLAKFRRALQAAMREVITAYNRERLDGGAHSIANLTPRGRPYFDELPEPEPTPEMAQPTPGPNAEFLASEPQATLIPSTPPNPLICSAPAASEPALLEVPATPPPEINAAPPTPAEAIRQEPETIATESDPESPPAAARPATLESPSPASSARMIDAEIFKAIDDTPAPPVAVGPVPGRDQTSGLAAAPTLPFTPDDAETPASIKLFGPSTLPDSPPVATPVNAAATIEASTPTRPFTAPGDLSPVTPTLTRGTGSPNASVHRQELLPPGPSAQPSPFKPDKASTAHATKASPALKPSEPSIEELIALHADPRKVHDAESARIRAQSEEEKAAKEKADLAGKTALKRSRFEWERQLTLLNKFISEHGKDANPLDVDAGDDWNVWLDQSPGTPRPNLRTVLAQIRDETKSNPDFPGREYFETIETWCGPILVSEEEKVVAKEKADRAAKAARQRSQFDWEQQLADLSEFISQHGDDDNPLDVEASDDWNVWLDQSPGTPRPNLRTVLAQIQNENEPNPGPQRREYFQAIEAWCGPDWSLPTDRSDRFMSDRLPHFAQSSAGQDERKRSHPSVELG